MMAVGLQRANIGAAALSPKVRSPIARFDPADAASKEAAAAEAAKVARSVAPPLTPQAKSMPEKVFEWADKPARLQPVVSNLPAAVTDPLPASPDIFVDDGRQPAPTLTATNPLVSTPKAQTPQAADRPAATDGGVAAPDILIAGPNPLPRPVAAANLPGAAPLDPTAKNQPGQAAEIAPTIVATNRLSPAQKQPAAETGMTTEPATAAATRPATGAARTERASELRAALEALRKEAAMSPAERVRRDVLKENKLTENDVKAMSAEDRKAIEEKIAPEVKKRLAAAEEQATRKRLQAAG